MLKILKSKQGTGAITAIVITLVLLLMFSLVMEYLRVYTIANGVREAATGNMNVLATLNADKTYAFVREGKNNMNADAEAVQRVNSLPFLLAKNLGLIPDGASGYKKLFDNGAIEYVFKDFDMTYTVEPLIFTVKLSLVIPVRFAGEVVMDAEIPLVVKSTYQEKY